MAEDEGAKGKQEESKKIVHTYPLVRHCDMSDEVKAEAIELVTTACEKFSGNNEAAAKMIKDGMDKKFGASWHVVVGEGYGFEVAYECKNMMYMFFGGNVAVIIWKCS